MWRGAKVAVTGTRLTAACTRPRVWRPLIENLAVAQLSARRVMPGVRLLPSGKGKFGLKRYRGEILRRKCL